MPRYLVTVNEWGTAQVPARIAKDLPMQRFISADDADSAIRQMEDEHGMGARINNAEALPIPQTGGRSMDEVMRAALEGASFMRAYKVREDYAEYTFRARTSEDTVFEFQEIDSDDNLVYTAQHEAFNAVILKLPEGYFLDEVVPHFIAIPNFRVEPVRPGQVSETPATYRTHDVHSELADALRAFLAQVAATDADVSDGYAIVTASGLLKHIESRYTLRVPKVGAVREEPAPYVGMKGTTSGFPATITRVCEWSRHDENPRNVLVEVRVPGGESCIDFGDFRPEPMKVSEGRPVYRVPRRRMHIEADGGLTYCGEVIALLSPGSVLDDDAADIIEYEPKGTCGRCIHYALIEVSASTWRAA